MSAFDFAGLPTRVILEDGGASRIGEYIDSLGGKRVMLICGGKTARSALIAKVKDALGARLVVFYDSIVEHSATRVVEEGARAAREKGVDFLLAVGGGSASDTAKAIAIVSAEGGPLSRHHTVFIPPDKYIQQPLPNAKLPIAVIPTTLSGAEVTPGLGIRNEENGKKLLFWDIKLAPRLILLDPSANMDVPDSIMTSTGMNALAHCVEGLYSKVRNPISEGLALQSIRLLYEALPAIVGSKRTVESMGRALTGAHLSGMVIANARVGIHHGVCHSLGAYGGLPHGVANAVFLPHAMRYNIEVAAGQLKLVAQAMGEDVRGLSDAQAAERAIAATQRLQQAIGVKTRLRDTGIDRATFKTIAEYSLVDRGLFFNPRPTASASVVVDLLESAW